VNDTRLAPSEEAVEDDGGRDGAWWAVPSSTRTPHADEDSWVRGATVRPTKSEFSTPRSRAKSSLGSSLMPVSARRLATPSTASRSRFRTGCRRPKRPPDLSTPRQMRTYDRVQDLWVASSSTASLHRLRSGRQRPLREPEQRGWQPIQSAGDARSAMNNHGDTSLWRCAKSTLCVWLRRSMTASTRTHLSERTRLAGKSSAPRVNWRGARPSASAGSEKFTLSIV
jgi:hypothetical protein